MLGRRWNNRSSTSKFGAWFSMNSAPNVPFHAYPTSPPKLRLAVLPRSMVSVSKNVVPLPPKLEPRYADANQLSTWSPPYEDAGAAGTGCVVVCAWAVPDSPATNTAAIMKPAIRIGLFPLLQSTGRPIDRCGALQKGVPC